MTNKRIDEDFNKCCLYIDMLIKEYVKCEDSKLTESAIKFKKQIIQKIKKWNRSCL